MFPRFLLLQVTWTHHRPAPIAKRRSRGPESTRSSSRHVRKTNHKWIYRWATCGVATRHQSSSDGYDSSRSWHMMEQRMDVLWWSSDENWSDENWSQSWTSRRGIVSTGCGQRGCIKSRRSLSDSWIEKNHRSLRDRGPIIARSWPDRAAIMAHLRRNQDHDHL